MSRRRATMSESAGYGRRTAGVRFDSTSDDASVGTIDTFATVDTDVHNDIQGYATKVFNDERFFVPDDQSQLSLSDKKFADSIAFAGSSLFDKENMSSIREEEHDRSASPPIATIRTRSRNKSSDNGKTGRAAGSAITNRNARSHRPSDSRKAVGSNINQSKHLKTKKKDAVAKYGLSGADNAATAYENPTSATDALLVQLLEKFNRQATVQQEIATVQQEILNRIEKIELKVNKPGKGSRRVP